jgi:hypothetical protein
MATSRRTTSSAATDGAIVLIDFGAGRQLSPWGGGGGGAGGGPSVRDTFGHAGLQGRPKVLRGRALAARGGGGGGGPRMSTEAWAVPALTGSTSVTDADPV